VVSDAKLPWLTHELVRFIFHINPLSLIHHILGLGLFFILNIINLKINKNLHNYSKKINRDGCNG